MAMEKIKIILLMDILLLIIIFSSGEVYPQFKSSYKDNITFALKLIEHPNILRDFLTNQDNLSEQFKTKYLNNINIDTLIKFITVKMSPRDNRYLIIANNDVKNISSSEINDFFQLHYFSIYNTENHCFLTFQFIKYLNESLIIDMLSYHENSFLEDNINTIIMDTIFLHKDVNNYMFQLYNTKQKCRLYLPDFTIIGNNKLINTEEVDSNYYLIGESCIFLAFKNDLFITIRYCSLIDSCNLQSTINHELNKSETHFHYSYEYEDNADEIFNKQEFNGLIVFEYILENYPNIRNQKHFKAFYCKGRDNIRFWLSKKSYEESDREIMMQILNSIKFEPIE
jgi:hypothetical protein